METISQQDQRTLRAKIDELREEIALIEDQRGGYRKWPYLARQRRINTYRTEIVALRAVLGE